MLVIRPYFLLHSLTARETKDNLILGCNGADSVTAGFWVHGLES